jgi:nucleotide-binding universal stress UspA family protein
MVIKVPRLDPGAPLTALTAFENELRILERVHGPHVPRLIAAGTVDQTPYLVLEYLERDDYARAAAEAPVTVERLRALGVGLCRAVHELHRQNVIHLDLNPRNVRVRANGEAVLIDFGLAHHASLPDLIDVAYGEQEGTVPYIAPEQVRHVRSEHRSDLYAIGAILYLYATGHYPFGRPNLLSLTRRLHDAPVPPRRHVPDLPPWLQEVILRLLEIRPEDRHATAREVAYLLSHPDAVPATPRGRRTSRPSVWTRAARWVRSLYEVFDEPPPARPYERLSTAPHVLVALDLDRSSVALQQALRNAVRKFVRGEPQAYITCLSVLSPAAAAENAGDETGEAPGRLVSMRHWAQPLRIPAERVFFHLATGTPANAILEYARAHLIDYIVLGARSDPGRRMLGGVAARVAADAPCSVIVVRSRREGARESATGAARARGSARGRSASRGP